MSLSKPLRQVKQQSKILLAIKADVDRASKVISQFNWQGSFTGLPVNDKVTFF